MVNALPPDFVEAMEKQKEKERRAKLREENLKLQKAEQERRQIRSLERFNAPVPKWTKKPEMKRSFLPDKKTARLQRGLLRDLPVQSLACAGAPLRVFSSCSGACSPM